MRTLSTVSAPEPMTTLAAPSERPATGELSMELARRGDRTYISRQYHRGALTLMRPLYLGDDGEASVTLINPGGGYLGGDVYDIEIGMGPGTAAIVTSQAATRVYRAPGEQTVQRTRLRLDDDACLTYVPDELIGYADARYRQHTEAVVHPSATLIAQDVITPGWSPDGRLFSYSRLHATFDVVAPSGRLLVRDNLLLAAGAPGPTVDPGVLGPGATHVGSLLVVSPRVDSGTIDEVRDVVACFGGDGTQVGVSSLPVPGLFLRVMGNSTGRLDRIIDSAIDHLRRQWFGRGPLPQRKY